MKRLILLLPFLLILPSCKNLNPFKKEPKIKYTMKNNGFKLRLYIDFYNNYTLWKKNDKITILIEKKNKDEIWLYDYDYSKKNGIDRVKNDTYDSTCYISHFPKYKHKKCPPSTMKKANAMYKRVLKKLKFKKFLERRKREKDKPPL